MRLREILGFVVRLVGLFFAAYGLYELIGSLVQFGQGLWQVMFSTDPFSAWVLGMVSVQLPAVLYIVAGWLILRYSESIVALAHRARKNTCPQCGYDLRASKERCPECGRAIDAPG